MEAIVAVYSDWGIGSGGTQPVVLKADRVHFRELTMGAAVIVGRKTLEDFPGGRPLKGRHNIVVSRQAITIEGAELVHSTEEALAAAERQMAQVYAPRLTGLAGECFRRLTQGRYDGLILMEDFRLLAREAETGLTRPLASLSRGTQDQAWLSLRLAMTRLLLPEDAPLILDDVFGTFDEARTRTALKLLKEEGRQILVFTCRELPLPDLM